MNSTSWAFAIAASALLAASAASADLRGTGMAGACAHRPVPRTFACAQRRIDVSGARSMPRNRGREVPSADDPPRSRPPAEMINGVDALRFDVVDPRTGRRTLFADADPSLVRDGPVR